MIPVHAGAARNTRSATGSAVPASEDPAPGQLKVKPRRRWRTLVAHVIYDLAYVVVLVVTCPYLAAQLILSRRYRVGLWQRVSFLPPRQPRPCLWVHGVSVGEVRTARPLVERLEATYPDLEVIISSTTMSGHSVARRTFPGHYVFYFPLDFGPVVRRVMRFLAPRAIVLM